MWKNGLYYGLKIGKNQTSDQGWEICNKDDILTVQEKRVALIGNKKKIIFEMTLRKRELEAKLLKTATIRIKKRIEE